MNIYKQLNQITNYIDEHLEDKIDDTFLAHFLGVNTYTMKRIFVMIAGISLSEYIRKRRLSNAGYDLYHQKQKIIDIAFKYQYENATSFSRAFEKFHGIKPSLVNKQTKLKNKNKRKQKTETSEKRRKKERKGKRILKNIYFHFVWIQVTKLGPLEQ